MSTRAERGTSEWWLDYLGGKITDRAKVIGKFDDYYSGKQGRRILSTSYRVLFEDVLGAYCENFTSIVVDAIAQRLEVQGFRFPTEPQDNRTLREPQEPADRDAWRIWQDNQLDAESQIAHTEALVKAVCYVLVSPFESEFIGESPRITIEDANNAIVEYWSGTNTRRIGMKQWWDAEEDTMLATLYFPDRIEKWRADGRHSEQSMLTRLATGEGAMWLKRPVAGELWPLPNPLGVVPLLELKNRPRLGHRVESEIAQIIPIQDAINTLAFNELVASDAAAFPQKWATGVEIPADPKNPGKAAPDWNPDIMRILSTIVPDAKFGSFAAADLNQWGSAIDRRVKRIASITETPYHMFLDHGGQPPSGEALRAAEAGLVRKAMGKHIHLGETWEEVIRLSFKAKGDKRADILDSETIWANPETLTEATHVDALVKLASINVPDEQLWEDAGYSPNQIDRFKQLRDAQPKPPPLPEIPAPQLIAVNGSQPLQIGDESAP